MDTSTAQALIRFGMGRRKGEALPGDPVAWLRQQLLQPDPALAEPGPTTTQALRAIQRDQQAMQTMGGATTSQAEALFTPGIERLALTPVITAAPFRERLVWFWINHFTVSLRGVGDRRSLLIAYVREAIRPHVTGRFEDMLTAVMHHPVMLLYLDNISSVGPASPFGLKTGRGLNENLARESLELHTLTQASGYTQQDVTEYAKILTGWTFNLDLPDQGTHFALSTHEPGPKTVLGETVPHGAAGLARALTFLAHHPATHRNLALKLCRHFIADNPPTGAVERIADVLRRSGGDLGAASMALIDLPEAWVPQTKLRGSADFAWAVLRGLGFDTLPPDFLGFHLFALDQPLLNPDFPAGFPDTAADWGNGALLLRRAEWLVTLINFHQDHDPVALAHDLLGAHLSETTLATVRGAASRRDALVLLFASPEFQRR